jgi:phage terminase small subunit
MATGHRSKAEKEQRQESEQAVYTGKKFKEHKRVKENQIAHAEFLRLKRLYQSIQYVDALDEQLINRYCLELAQVEPLEKLVEKMEDSIDKCENPGQMVKIYQSIAGTLKALASKKAMLLTMEDRLYLNPTARMRSIPKSPPKEKEKNPMESAGFDV